MSKTTKIILVCVIVYLFIGSFFAGNYLYSESKTFECLQSDGSILTTFNSKTSQTPSINCTNRLSLKNSSSTTVILFLGWLPLVARKSL